MPRRLVTMPTNTWGSCSRTSSQGLKPLGRLDLLKQVSEKALDYWALLGPGNNRPGTASPYDDAPQSREVSSRPRVTNQGQSGF